MHFKVVQAASWLCAAQVSDWDREERNSGGSTASFVYILLLLHYRCKKRAGCESSNVKGLEKWKSVLQDIKKMSCLSLSAITQIWHDLQMFIIKLLTNAHHFINFPANTEWVKNKQHWSSVSPQKTNIKDFILDTVKLAKIYHAILLYRENIFQVTKVWVYKGKKKKFYGP